MQASSVALGMAMLAWRSTTFVFDWSISEMIGWIAMKSGTLLSKIPVWTNSNQFKHNTFRATHAQFSRLLLCNCVISLEIAVRLKMPLSWKPSPHIIPIGPYLWTEILLCYRWWLFLSFGRGPSGWVWWKVGSQMRFCSWCCSNCFWDLCCHLGDDLAGGSSDLLSELIFKKWISAVCKTIKPIPVWLMVLRNHNKKTFWDILSSHYQFVVKWQPLCKYP